MANCYINISSSAQLENVENLIMNQLSEIKKKIPAIKEDIIYKGLVNVTDVATELLFSATCYEEDLYQVQRDLHRELKLLLDKHSIDSFAPPTYVIQQRMGQQNYNPVTTNPQGVNPRGGQQVTQQPASQPTNAVQNVKRPPQAK